MGEEEVAVVADAGVDAAPKEEREQWSSRLAFWFAAVGSAVGFGNVWRFPSLAYLYGGGAFFIPYWMALFLIGIPITLIEVGLGQFHQTGDVGAFSRMHRRLGGVGFSSIVCGYIVVTYYCVLLAWVINVFFDSFGDSAPWTKEGVTAPEAYDYFKNEIIGMSTLTDTLRPQRLVWKNVAYSALGFLVVFCCLAFGVKNVGRITYFSMGFPIVVLFALAILGFTLEGAGDGIESYIGEWDVSILKSQGDVWTVAVSQIFFSIGITFGILTAYGSHCPRNEPALLNATVIALANSFYSFIAGFAVFSCLGHLAHLQNASVDDVSVGGFGLVFGAWPVVLGTLPGGIHWVRLLFFMLFLLGIDSAFALLESSLTVVKDAVKRVTGKDATMLLTGLSCVVAWLFSLIYCTDAGLLFLDAVDYYINFIMLFVGLLETFAVGWAYDIDAQFDNFSVPVVVAFMVSYFFPVFLASALWFGIDDSSTAIISGFVAYFVTFAVGMGITLFMLSKVQGEKTDKYPTFKSIVYDLFFKNIFDFKYKLEPVIGMVPYIWCFLVKFFIPPVLVILFVNGAAAENGYTGESKFGHYENLVSFPYQFLGILAFAFASFCFLIGVIAPDVYIKLWDPEEKEPSDFVKGEKEEDEAEEAEEVEVEKE